LNEQEASEYAEFTRKIRVLGRRRADEDKSSEGDRKKELLKLLLVRRAAIIKSAVQKVEVATNVIAERYSPKGRWIVYCQDENQLNAVAKELRLRNKHTSILTYHSKMSQSEREMVLNLFEKEPSLIISIRCLDEGVDIPTADGALILASSMIPRIYSEEGKSSEEGDGKNVAQIIDVLVLPDHWRKRTSQYLW